MDYYILEVIQGKDKKYICFDFDKWSEVSDWLKEHGFLLIYTDPEYGDRIYENLDNDRAKLTFKNTNSEYPCTEYY